MRPAILLMVMAPALVLAGCNKADSAADNAANAAAPVKPVAGVPAPAGTRWSEHVAATPEGGFRMGNPNAPIKLIEYGSYTCPHCRDFAKESDEPLRAKVDSGKLSYEFRAFVRDPLDLTMALIARCGGTEPFFAMTRALYANQEAMFAHLQSQGDKPAQAAMALPPAQRFTKLAEIAGLIDFAKAHGLPEQQVRTCVADIATAEKIAKGNDVASSQFNVTGTPTLIINGSKVENVATWPTLEEKLREAGA
jgi:protein-disulfide isomerase